MDLVGLLVPLVSGAVGGHVGGRVMRSRIGLAGGLLAGMVGGGLGGEMANATLGLAAVSGPLDIRTLALQALGSGAGGAVLAVLVGWINRALSRA